MTRLLLAGLLVLAAGAVWTAQAPQAHGCAFSRTPTTYEGPQDRSPYRAALELAGHNMLFPTDTFFGTPRLETGVRGDRHLIEQPYIPPTLLKAIGWIESGIAQADYNTPFGGIGPTLISFDCGHGIMQITSGMTSPNDGSWPSKQQALVATHYGYDIARGAAILVEKWNGAPEVRPVAGSDTNGNPIIAENWYFAVWGYNGFTGPGANRSNHPSDPDYAWPRTGFSCGRTDDGYGHSYGNYPYQELVFGCAQRPALVGGEQLWPRLRLSLPDLDDDLWSEPLSLSNWSACSRDLNCAAMDIPSPSPFHVDPTDQPSDEAVDELLGAPVVAASHGLVRNLTNQVTIYNVGNGVLPWRAKPAQNWITVDKQGGVAISEHVECSTGAPCERSPTLTIRVNASRLPAGRPVGWVDVESLTTGQVWQIGVEPNVTPTPTSPNAPTATRTPTRTPTPSPSGAAGDANCNGAPDSVDAALILQYGAGLTSSLPCPGAADANRDGRIDALDAALVLQFVGGLITALPP